MYELLQGCMFDGLSGLVLSIAKCIFPDNFNVDFKKMQIAISIELCTSVCTSFSD